MSLNILELLKKLKRAGHFQFQEVNYSHLFSGQDLKWDSLVNKFIIYMLKFCIMCNNIYTCVNQLVYITLIDEILIAIHFKLDRFINMLKRCGLQSKWWTGIVSYRILLWVRERLCGWVGGGRVFEKQVL